MMPALLVSSDVPPPVRRYLIATAGKKRIDFYNNRLFAGDSRLIGYRNPFARQKNLPNTGETQLVPAGEIDQKIDGLLTTSHLLLPNEPRRTGFLLPISQPNSTLLVRKSTRQDLSGGPGGVSQTQRPKMLDRKALTKFLSYWLPCPVLVALKKRRFEPRPNSKPSAPGLSRELTSNPQ
jgi:hypothetical protein